MIVTGKFTQLQLNKSGDSTLHKLLEPDYHGEFESIDHLIGSLKTKPLVIGEFLENINIYRLGENRNLFVMSQIPNIYKHLEYHYQSILDKTILDLDKYVVLLNLKEAKDDQNRMFWYILDALVME